MEMNRLNSANNPSWTDSGSSTGAGDGVFRGRDGELMYTTPASHASGNNINRYEERRKLRRTICFIVVVLVLGMAFIIAAGKSMSNGMNSDEKAAASVMSDYLINQDSSIDKATLNDPKTPQGMALQWIVEHNPNDKDDDDGEEKLLLQLQRYVLVVFFFSTLGTVDGDGSILYTSWDNTTNWMTDASVCTWYGVTCVEELGQRFDSLSKQQQDGLILSVTLPSNSILGTLPEEFKLLNQLHTINLSDNAIQGNIPSGLALTPKLQELNLSNNAFDGKIPSEFGRLQKLQILDLSKNDLTGTIPNEIGNAYELQILNLQDNSLIGGIVDLSLLGESLLELDLSHNQLYGTLPDFYDMFELKLLQLSYNELIGTIPNQYRAMSQLEILDLSNNELTGIIPGNVFETMEQLQTLKLSSNELNGPIPTYFLKNLNALQTLDLAMNELSGTIEDWSPFAGLTTLRLDKNKFEGELPLISMPNMKFFSISTNEFLGYIPTQFADMVQLEELSLDENELSGTIPGEIFQNMVNLTILNLEDNHIMSGTIPSELESMTTLFFFGLDDTAVTGGVSSVFCDWKDDSSRIFELTVDCDYIGSCDCCGC